MWLYLLFTLILSGILTYILLRRTVSQMTMAPLWLLWSILMTPPLLAGAMVTWGKQIPSLPASLLVCAICWFCYWRLLDWSRLQQRSKSLAQAPTLADLPGGDEILQLAELDLPATPVLPIDPAEEATLRTCFAWNVFFLEKIEYRPQAVLCRGKLRTDADAAYQTIVKNVRDLFGDRFYILFQYSLSTGKPFFALVPQSPNIQPSQSRRWLDYGIASILLGFTFISTTFFGAALTRFHPSDLEEIIRAGLPYALSTIAILGIRDIGRYLVAKFYQIDSTLPYFIPLPFLPGTYGCMVQLQSPIPNRKAVFDLGFVSATLGLITAIPILLWGLGQSEIVPLDPKATLFNFHAFNPRFSLLLTVLCKLALGNPFTIDRAIDLHNVAIAAYISLLIITINLIPLRRMDGGYIVHGMFGQKPSAIVSQLSKVVLLILGFIRFKASSFGNTDLLFLAIVISLIPAIDEPALNDVSELNNWRDALGIIILAILVLILIPVPTILSSFLAV
jgi:membrane-associated protease RseP (regulator of RpoE activity)